MKTKQKPAQNHQPEENDFGKFLDIDLLQLELEWAQQPKLARKWLRKLAKAKKDLRDEEDNFKLVEAQLRRLVTAAPEDYGVRKVTNPAIEAAIIEQDLYQDCKKRISQLEYEVDLLKANTIALDHRKSALEDEVKLFLKDYYAEPVVRGRGAREAVDEMEQREVASRGRVKRRREE